MSCEVIKELNEVTDFQLSRLIHFSKGTSTTNFKTAKNSGCRSPIFQVKTHCFRKDPFSISRSWVFGSRFEFLKNRF